MTENVQYKTRSDAEKLPTQGPNLRSTLDVPVKSALPTLKAMVVKDLQREREGAHAGPIEGTA